jgi:hypothetical protein
VSIFLVQSKRRKTDKVGKGLRHFSMKVCEKVRKKGTTSYNEVADELVAEFTNPSLMTSPTDQVNIKNVIIAVTREPRESWHFYFLSLFIHIQE